MNLLVSQFVSVILANVNLALLFRARLVEISSTLKSETLDFSLPPIPEKEVENPSKPIISAVGVGMNQTSKACRFKL